MGKYCNSGQILKNQRRSNGLQLPLNWQQIVSWIVLFTTAVINLSITSLIQFDQLKITSLIIYIILYVSHIASHVAALTIDPAEEDLRNRETCEVPEFDRNLHAHVIENGRCHLCNIYTSNKKTKHCGLCNKCVYEFDHHCKWLNNCIGKRNYKAFLGCVTTALFISAFTFALCIVDIVWFFVQPQLLSSETQKFINCNSTETVIVVKFCQSSITFLIFLIILCVSGIAMAGALLHLCCFHIYISLLGVSTYEYIMRNSNKKSTEGRCCRMKFERRPHTCHSKKTQDSSDGYKYNTSENKENPGSLNKNNTNAIDLFNILVDTDKNKTIKIFSSDNKIYPDKDNEIS